MGRNRKGREEEVEEGRGRRERGRDINGKRWAGRWTTWGRV